MAKMWIGGSLGKAGEGGRNSVGGWEDMVREVHLQEPPKVGSPYTGGALAAALPAPHPSQPISYLAAPQVPDTTMYSVKIFPQIIRTLVESVIAC